MNPETTPTRSEILTRKQKLLRRFLPLALVAGAGAGYAHHEVTTPEAAASVASSSNSQEKTVIGNAEATFESGNGWGQAAATEAIEEAVTEAATTALEKTGTTSPADVAAIVDSLPAYDQANTALDMADYRSTLPDAGDTLNVTVQVTANDKQQVSYEVIDAQIDDTSSSDSK